MFQKSLHVTDTNSGWIAHTQVDKRFHGLVNRLSAEAALHPTAYRRRVIFAALLGYGFIGLMLAMLLGLVAICVTALFYSRAAAAVEVKIAIVAGLVAFALARSMIVAQPEPDGVPITPSEAPELYDMIAEVLQKFDRSNIDAVYITDEMNASIAQPARLGIFGVRNILSLGLPLMYSLSRAELMAVIAHELGHSVGNHGRWAGFVYRVRTRWMQLAERLPTGIVAGLLKRFFNWYGPWFNAYSFVLARTQEYEADRAAAKLVTPEIAGSALVRVELQAERFSDHWQKVWGESRTALAPSAMPYASLQQSLEAFAEQDEARFAKALTRLTDLDDTHPSLADRLHALSAPVGLPPPLAENAAVSLLGPFAAQLAEKFDREWWDSNGDWWETCHSTAQDEAEELLCLKETIASGTALLKDHERFIDLVQTIEGEDAAIAARRNALELEPGMTSIRYQLGVSLIDRADAEGIEHIETAISSWPALGPYGYDAIASYLRSVGSDRLDHYLDLLEQSEVRSAKANEESRTIDRSEILESLSLDPLQRDELIASLHGIEGLKWIMAGQRCLELSNTRQTIFVFASRRGSASTVILDQVIDLFIEHGDVLGLEKSLSTNWLVKRIASLEGSLLLKR